YGAAMRAKATSPAAMLAMMMRIASLLPTHTRRSEESESLQQFSTPIGLAFVASQAASITPADLVLEPSAGTGLLAIFAELAGASLILNEFAESRAGILGSLFPDLTTTQFDAAHIDDHLDAGIVPSVVLMNPPFSAAVHVNRPMADAALRHVGSALARLPEGGRLVTITGANIAPDNPVWADSFVRLQEQGRIVFSAAIDGAVYARHGTNVDTRLTVIDRVPADDITALPASPGIAPDLSTLLDWVIRQVPPRQPIVGTLAAAVPAIASLPTPRTARASVGWGQPAAAALAIDMVATEVAYEPTDGTPTDGSNITDALYEPYSLQSIRIPGAKAHPSRLVQSAAMASVASPKPSYRPHLPANVIADGILSDAQLESVIYAGEAHSEFLAGSWTVDATFDVVAAARDDATDAVRFRRGWFLGDGTGSGKGRQVAGILLDNWLKGRRRAVWISKSDKLIEDAQRVPAALITGIRSDLPGQITAQVTSSVYDSPTGRALLIPQGARLIGTYDSQISFGQSRVMLVWTRLIMPNGRSIVLERQAGADAGGYSGLEDEVDNHWKQLLGAAALSTLLSVGTEVNSGVATNNTNAGIIQALRMGAADSLNQTGQQVVRRNLNVQPTLTIRPGFPVRVIVNRDLILEPYKG
ncbi:MAG TPA: TrbI/VirB10 family protein, partial [Gemmataceae bacterium]|nr:TrbI/VirB10 family protein [Gemmataceae bacterium]